MKLGSAAFPDGGTIPAAHTCDGADRSPPLAWSGIPAEAKSLALICDDPDAPGKTWVHWVLFNIPPTLTALHEDIAKTDNPSDLGGALQGVTDFKRVGYGGPCPPPGKPHRYYFKLYALDAHLPLKAGATKADVERTLQNRVLAEAQLMGTFGRTR